MNKRYHLIVLGAGSGGLVAAAGTAGLGAKVALIERHAMGGDCLNSGCVPSKAIIRAAKLAHDARTARRFGLTDMAPDIDLARVMASVRAVQQQIAPHDSIERFQSLGVDVYQGTFHFRSSTEVTDGRGTTLVGRRFVIATGARPFVPPISGLATAPHVTSDTVWDLHEVPKRLVVLGGGPIGAELAQVFARLGSAVTLIEMGERLLIREDPDVSRCIQERFAAEGIHVLLHTKAAEVRPGGLLVADGMDPSGGQQTIAYDQILVAVGRAPNVEDLALENAGVAYDKKGIRVDATLRTSAKHIYACGDVIGHYQFTHTADAQARLILRNALFPGRLTIDYRVVPWCTFTDPEVARAGLNVTEAEQQKIPVDVFTYAMADLDRAVCDRETEGFIKVLTRKGTDVILGTTLVGSHAGDLLHELALAMHQRIGLKKIATMIHVYPTLAEVSKRIADTYQRTRLTATTKKWLRRYFQWRFG